LRKKRKRRACAFSEAGYKEERNEDARLLDAGAKSESADKPCINPKTEGRTNRIKEVAMTVKKGGRKSKRSAERDSMKFRTLFPEKGERDRRTELENRGKKKPVIARLAFQPYLGSGGGSAGRERDR